jgi:Cohesin domain
MIRKSLLPIFLLMLALLGTLDILPNARGTTQTLVCIADQTVDPTECPAQPANLTGEVGSTITLAVNVQGIDNLNGFDVAVQVNPAVLQPVSVSIADSLLPEPRFVVVQSVNSTNGVAEVAMVALGCCFDRFSETGNLFNIVYKILSSNSGTSIMFRLGCSDTSLPGVCVTLVNPLEIPVTVQTASLGLVTPDFSIGAAPSHRRVQTGFSVNSTIVLESVGAFSGPVDLSIAITPSCSVAICPSQSLNSTSVTLGSSPGTTTAWTTLFFLSSPEEPYAPVKDWSINVTGTSGSRSHSVLVTFTVLPPRDFSVSAIPSSLIVSRGQSVNSTIEFLIPTFAGSNPDAKIALSTSIIPQINKGPSLSFLPAWFYHNGLIEGIGGSCTSETGNCPPLDLSLSLRVSANQTTRPGTYSVTITAEQLPSASVGLLIRTATLTVTVVPNTKASTAFKS